jgi:hypothetical protein
MYWIQKIYIAKQFREIIYMKFRKMYWYFKNVHSETISRNNLYEISQNFVKESTTKYRGISQNFAKLKSLSSLFRISRNKKILFRDHPMQNAYKEYNEWRIIYIRSDEISGPTSEKRVMHENSKIRFLKLYFFFFFSK